MISWLLGRRGFGVLPKTGTGEVGYYCYSSQCLDRPYCSFDCCRLLSVQQGMSTANCCAHPAVRCHDCASAMRDSIFPLIGGGGTSNTGGSRLTPLHSRIAKIIGRRHIFSLRILQVVVELYGVFSGDMSLIHNLCRIDVSRACTTVLGRGEFW
jgi:hypothetical protein